jgi:small subunit ribosomal protein S17
MTGIVTSNKMMKSLVVTVFSTKTHPKYKKKFKSRKKYSVSCSDSSNFKIGDKVEIVSVRPVSKTISFKVLE